jgi:hypothetical protein
MATRRYMINAGEVQNQVTEAVGAATATKNIELTVDLAAVKTGSPTQLTKAEILLALDAFRDYITTNIWPPA